MSTRRHAHNALRPDLEDLCRQLFDRMSSGVAIYEAVEDGRNFVIVDFNSAGERIDGVFRTDLVGRRVTEAFPGVEEFGLLDVFRHVWKTGEAAHHPARYYDDGSIKGWRDNYVFKLPKTGHIVAIYDVPTDLRSVLDGLFGFVGIYMPDGVLVEANRAPLEAAGLTREDVIGKPFWETPWWSHSPAVQDQLRRALERAAAGETIRDDFSVRIGSDATITIDASFGPLRNQQGEITRLIGFGIDVTDRLQTETALRESEELFKAQFNGIPIPTYSWRKVEDDFELVDFNARAHQITQGQIKRFLGTKAGALYAEDPHIVAWMHEVFDRRCTETRELEYNFRCIGDVRDMRVTLGFGPPDLLLVHTEDVTERKKADQALKHSEARLANAQRIAHIGNWDWEIVAGDLHWSDEIYRIFGLEPQQFGATYEAFLETIHPEDRSMVERAVTAALEEDAPYSIEHRIVLSDGEVRIVHEQAEVERDESGVPVAMRGTVQDITERIQAEKSARENSGRIRGVLENVADSVITMTEDGLIESVNPAAERMFGYAASEMVGEPVTMLMTGGDRKNHDNYIRHYLQSGRSNILGVGPRELTARRKDGSTFPISLAVSEMQTGGQQLFIGSARDVTERKQWEKDLKKKSDILQMILDTMDQGISVMDANFINAASNEKFLELLEFAPDMGPGTPFERYIRYNAERGEYGPGDVDELVRERVELAKQFKAHQFERVRPDGTVIEIRGNPSADGGFVTTYTDVTERKRAEEALREALLQAESANRSKSEFLANMSHELRTPLNAIIGFSQVLQDELKGPLGDPAYRQYARDIHESGTLLLSLISDILDLSKIEAGKLELHEARQSVPEIVGACRRIIESRAKDAGLILETRLNSGLPCLQVDGRALKQIILNLLSNAVKFTPEGGRIAVDAWVDDDGCFTISVSDTGIGIAPADIPKALSAFTQVENYLTREQPGTGLGLPLAKSLVEAHGGTLELESELGRGATATIRFPAERVMTAKPAAAQGREAGAA